MGKERCAYWLGEEDVQRKRIVGTRRKWEMVPGIFKY